jgi:hypothetical protein
MGAGAVRDLVALLAASVPDELPGGRVVPGEDDPWSLLLGLQAFYRTVLAGDGAVALAGADGGLWTIPVREVRGVRVRMVAPEPGADDPSEVTSHVPEVFRSAFGG